MMELFWIEMNCQILCLDHCPKLVCQVPTWWQTWWTPFSARHTSQHRCPGWAPSWSCLTQWILCTRASTNSSTLMCRPFSCRESFAWVGTGRLTAELLFKLCLGSCLFCTLGTPGIWLGVLNSLTIVMAVLANPTKLASVWRANVGWGTLIGVET